MSDFDFDELDKAVTGALKSPAPANETPAVETEPTKDTPEPIPMPEKPVPPAIRRGSGRFMDVVHPSSDMRSSSRPAAQQAESALAQPSQENTDQQNGFVSPVTKPAVEPEQPSEPEVKHEDTTPEVLQELTSLDALSPVGEWSKPLESPFLPDAKVEKRPLGGAGGADAFASLLETPNDELLLEAPDEPRLEATTMPDPIDFAAHTMALPIENEDTGIQAKEQPLPTEEEPTKTEQSSEEKPFDLLGAVMETENKEVAEAPTEPIGPTSITQQYIEQASTEQSSGAIYDTENYHQPLAHAGKKHSSVWAILGIILLVLLGAGAGVAFYFFVLPML